MFSDGISLTFFSDMISIEFRVEITIYMCPYKPSIVIESILFSTALLKYDDILCSIMTESSVVFIGVFFRSETATLSSAAISFEHSGI